MKQDVTSIEKLRLDVPASEEPGNSGRRVNSSARMPPMAHWSMGEL